MMEIPKRQQDFAQNMAVNSDLVRHDVTASLCRQNTHWEITFSVSLEVGNLDRVTRWVILEKRSTGCP